MNTALDGTTHGLDPGASMVDELQLPLSPMAIRSTSREITKRSTTALSRLRYALAMSLNNATVKTRRRGGL